MFLNSTVRRVKYTSYFNTGSVKIRVNNDISQFYQTEMQLLHEAH